jgi:hypothetical protein
MYRKANGTNAATADVCRTQKRLMISGKRKEPKNIETSQFIIKSVSATNPIFDIRFGFANSTSNPKTIFPSNPIKITDRKVFTLLVLG